MTLEHFKAAVRAEFAFRCSLPLEELYEAPDYDAAWQAGVTPRDYVEEFICRDNLIDRFDEGYGAQQEWEQKKAALIQNAASACS